MADSKSVMRKKASIAQILLAWLLSQRNFIIPIPETTKIRRLGENLNASLISFSKAELDEINANLSKITIVGERYAPGSDATKSVGL